MGERGKERCAGDCFWGNESSSSPKGGGKDQRGKPLSIFWEGERKRKKYSLQYLYFPKRGGGGRGINRKNYLEKAASFNITTCFRGGGREGGVILAKPIHLMRPEGGGEATIFIFQQGRKVLYIKALFLGRRTMEGKSISYSYRRKGGGKIVLGTIHPSIWRKKGGSPSNLREGEKRAKPAEKGGETSSI